MTGRMSGLAARGQAVMAEPEGFVSVVLPALIVVLFFGDLASQVLSGLPRSLLALLRDVLLLALVVVAAPHWRRVPRPLALAVSAVVLLAGVAALRAPSIAAAVLEVRAVYWGLALLLVCVVMGTPALVERTARAVAMTGTVAAAVATVTWLLGGVWLNLVVDTTDGLYAGNYFTHGQTDRPRAFSPFIEPNMLGAAMVVVLLTVLLLPGLSRRVRVWLLVLPAVALGLSQSRSAMSGLLLGLVVLALTSARGRRALAAPHVRRYVIGALALGLVVFVAAWVRFASVTSDPSARFHLQTLLDGPRLLLENWYGTGLGTVGPRATIAYPGAVQVESGLLIIGLELGLLGLAAFVAVWVVLGVRLVRALRPTTAPWHARWGAGVLVGALPTLVLLAMIQSTSVVWTWWIVLGLAYSVAPRPRATPTRTDGSTPAPQEAAP